MTLDPVSAIQLNLRQSGYPVAVDGVIGNETLGAIQALLTQRHAAPPKPPWASRTVIGAAVVVVSQLVRLFWPEVEVDVGATVDAITSLFAILGGLLAWWGRLKAERPIRWGRARASIAPAGADPAALRVRELPPNTRRPAGVSGAADPGRGGDEFDYLGGFRSD